VTLMVMALTTLSLVGLSTISTTAAILPLM
jgi:hypothetical protein